MNSFTTKRRLQIGVLAGCMFTGAVIADEAPNPATASVAEPPVGPVAAPALAPEPEPAIDATAEPAVDAADTAPGGADARAAAQKQFLRLNDEERFEEAAAAARQVVELTQREFGPDVIQMAKPLINLATMQLEIDDLVSAEANYKRSVTIIEKHDGRLSARLINPLVGLGATYNRAGTYQQGAAVLERALRINHVNEGFYNFSQFKIQDGLTESYVGLQEIGEANFFQETQVEIYQRRNGVDDPAIAPGLYKLAEWYARSGQIEAAMQTYRRADSLIRKKGGGDGDLARIEGLEGMADIYERIGNQSAGASALKRALKVVDSQPEVDFAKRAAVLVRLGDLYMRSGKTSSADKRYASAWHNLSGDEAFLDLRDDYFAIPVRVAGRRLTSLRYAPNARGKTAQRLSEGHVLISYAVNSRGRVENVNVVESDPPGIMDEALVSTFSRSSFRPRREDGKAVDADRLLYRLDFLYATESTRGNGKSSDEPLQYPGAPSDDNENADAGNGPGDADVDRLEYPEGVPD